MSIELDDEVFIGPVTDAELSKQQQRRRTLIELPTPVGKRVLSMSVKSFVVVPRQSSPEPETPSKVFELLKDQTELDRFQIRRKNRAMRELLMDDYEEEEVWSAPAVASFVRIPEKEPKEFKTIVAQEEFVIAQEELACSSVSLENQAASVAFLVPTPAKNRGMIVQDLNCSSRTAAERALRLGGVLAEREFAKCGQSSQLQPDPSAWKKAFQWLTEGHKQRIAQLIEIS